MTSLPARLPARVNDLIMELDDLNKPPVIVGPVDPKDIQELVFAAGRRSIIDELLRLQEKEKKGV